MGEKPLDRIFRLLLSQYNEHVAKGVIHPEFTETVETKLDFGGEVLMGHLRSGASSRVQTFPRAIRSSGGVRGRRATWRSAAISTSPTPMS